MENNYLTINDNCPSLKSTAKDEERELAILFLDIRNFTGLMESQPEQAVIQVVRRLFTAFNQIIKSFQGKVVEMAGDNLYAVFGLQNNLREAVNNAYHAAKAMFKTVMLFNEAYNAVDQYTPLQIGVGMHAGRVFVGEFAIDGKPQLSVMGLPVNIASRLQAKTKEINNDMLISEYAYNMLNLGDLNANKQTIALQGITHGQQVRLAGQPYDNTSPALNMDYLLAISG